MNEIVPMLAPDRLVFLDETAVATSLGRNYGWAPRGIDAELRRDPYPEHLSVVGAMALDGVRTSMAIEGAFDGHAFLPFVENFLVPVLRPGDIVVMDNLRVHKVAGVREAIEAAGAFVLHQPAYSPDFNPIECLWCWIKSRIRDVVPDSLDEALRLFGKALHDLPTEYISAWFRHCGYERAAESC